VGHLIKKRRRAELESLNFFEKRIETEDKKEKKLMDI